LMDGRFKGGRASLSARAALVGIVERLAPGLIRLFFRLERFFPRFIRFLLTRRLREYKERGVIVDYKVKAERIDRFHYRFEVELFLKTSKGR